MELWRNQHIITLSSVLGLCVFIWLSDGWFSSGDAGLSLTCRMAFCAAALLYGAPSIVRLGREPADARLLRLRSAAMHGAHWFVVVIILSDSRLPSGDAARWLLSAVFFGFILVRLHKPSEARTGAAASGFTLYTPFLVWVLMAAFTFLPLQSDQGYAVFALILALGVAAPGPKSWAALRWPDWAMSALAVAAVLTGLFTAP